MRETSTSGRVHDVRRGAIEEIRIIAAVLLVGYHVIGLPNTGLRLQYPHELRFLADLFANFRMPAFAFVAGFIYAIRPPRLETFDRFVEGKLRRLAVPGIVAALIFLLAASVLGRRNAVPLDALWQVLFYPYAHYWFLQAILGLFCVVGLMDATLRHRGEWLIFAAALGLAAAPIAPPSFFSIDKAIRLAPCFVLGICVYRHAAWIERHAGPITLAATVALLLTLGEAVVRHAVNPTAPPPATLLQTMALGMSACLLMLLHLPHHPRARALGQFTFTIYLYHVFGTTGMRTLLHGIGIQSVGIHLLLGLCAGIAVPVLLHRLAMRSPLTALIFLGLRPAPARQAVPFGPPATPRPAA